MKTIQLHKGKKYSICSCGLSRALPFCDNAHREFNVKNGTDYKSVKITVEDTVEAELNSANWKR